MSSSDPVVSPAIPIGSVASIGNSKLTISDYRRLRSQVDNEYKEKVANIQQEITGLRQKIYLLNEEKMNKLAELVSVNPVYVLSYYLYSYSNMVLSPTTYVRLFSDAATALVESKKSIGFGNSLLNFVRIEVVGIDDVSYSLDWVDDGMVHGV